MLGAGQDRAGQGRAGQGRAGQGRGSVSIIRRKSHMLVRGDDALGGVGWGGGGGGGCSGIETDGLAC